MLCARCGEPNPDTIPFCGKCGALLEARSGVPPTAQNKPDQALVGNPWKAMFEQNSSPSGMAEGAAPSFAPVAHIPFSEDPLPQPSQPLPAFIQPAGDIQTFTPAATAFEPARPSTPESAAPVQASDRHFADYPTDVRVPVPVTPPLQQAGQAPTVYSNNQPPARDLKSQAQAGGWESTTPASGSLASEMSTPNRLFPAEVSPSRPPGTLYHGPASSVFQNSWEQDEDFSPFKPLPPSQPLGNPYQVLPGNASSFNDTWDQSGGYTPFVQAMPTGPSLGNVYPGLPKKPLNMELIPSSGSLDMPPDEVNRFVRPLPLWASASGIVVGALLLVGLIFLNPDWATGALIAGVIAIILAVLLLIASGVRVALGILAPTNPRRTSQVVSASLLVLLLFAFSGVSLSQQTGLHAMQARYLEGQHNWQAAANEFQDAGEIAPASTNLARVYNEWGEALVSQHQYADAVAKFGTVIHDYTGVSAQVKRAQTDMISAYLNWASSAARGRDYAHATSYYDTLLKLSYCTATCQSQAQTADATAYYDLAEQQLGLQQYTRAVNAFTVLSTNFPNAPEVKKSHGDYAKALWGLGQQQLTTTCSNAVMTYQQLAHQFGDTSQGQQAGTALQQSVGVKGHFTTPVPGPPANPTVSLVQGMYFGITGSQFAQLVTNAPHTPVQSNGDFTFSSVPQGTYTLVWSYDGQLHYTYGHNQNQMLYQANLGPLCTYNYGDIPETISAP
jgi:tetratricopeptide (TPR) repeat protein